MTGTRTRLARRGVSATALATASILVLAACGGSGGGDGATGSSREGGLTKVVFAQPVPQSVIQWPTYVADELGYFAEEGIEVSLAPASDISMAAFVTNGSAKISAAGASEVLFASREGAELAVVMDWWTRSAEGVVTLADSGIQSTEDLAGTKVGVPSDEDRSFLTAALGAVGLSADDVEVVVTGDALASVANALRKGDIDAFSGATSDFAALQAAGLELRDVTPEELAATPASSMVVTDEVLKNERDVIVGFLRAYAKATHAGLANPEGLKAMSAAIVPDEWRDEEAGTALLEVVLFNAQPDDGSRIGDVRRQVWEQAQEQLIAVGELDGPEDLDAILDDSLIEEVNDFDRAAVEKDLADWVEANAS